MNLSNQRERIRAAMGTPTRRWYDIRNTNTDNAVVRIYDEIGWLGTSADQFAADLDTITADTIEVQINSPGGSVFDGIAIYNALRAHPARIVTRVDGLAASIASVIAQAGDRRVILPAAQMMVHRAWGACVGNTNDMTDMATVLAKQDTVIAEIYANRAGRKARDFLPKMETETWYTADEAVAAGLADEVHTDTRPQARTGFDPTLSLKLLDL